MSLARFHLPPDQWSGDTVCLMGEEAKHCSQVMRRGSGDKIVVFDGAGIHARATITSIADKRVELNLAERSQTPHPAVAISLIQAIPKGSNMELIIEKAVELGVNQIQPVFTERTIVRLDAQEGIKKQQKWQRIALEACKQCGQNWLPIVHPPCSLKNACGQLPPDCLKLIAAIQPDALPLKAILAKALAFNHATVCIGPEGDFSTAEYALAREHGFHPLSLGPIILRVETASLFTLSILQHELREGGPEHG